MVKKIQNVLPNSDNLTVNDADSEKVTKTFDKKKDAIDQVKEIAKISSLNLSFINEMKLFKTKKDLEMTLMHQKI